VITACAYAAEGKSNETKTTSIGRQDRSIGFTIAVLLT
jgi:hypothetical protein